MTDSGGLQEETTAPKIRKHVLVLRLSTERPESVDADFATVTGVEKKIQTELQKTLKQPTFQKLLT